MCCAMLVVVLLATTTMLLMSPVVVRAQLGGSSSDMPGRVSKAPGVQTVMASERFTQVFRDIARTAAGNNDFAAFHAMHATLRDVSQLAARTELVSPPVLNKHIDAPAVFHAAYLGHKDFVRQYVEGGYPIDKTTDLLPYLSVWREQRGLSDVSVQHLLTGFEVPASVLHASILGNHVELTRLLIASGVSAEGPDGALQPLHLAAANDNVEIIDLLVPELNTTDINATTHELAETFTALHFASLYGNAAAVERLLELGADANNNLNPTGRTPLFLAAVSNDTSTVWLLLQHNASCALDDRTDRTALHVPIAAGNLAMFELLLEAHCDIRSRLPNDETPLLLAARLDRPEYIELLLAHGADIEETLPNGDTPLIVAAKRNSVNAARVLLQHGASLTAVNQRTLGVLHAAARAGHAEMIELLAQRGADPTALASNHTALEIAIMHQHLEALRKMLELKFPLRATALSLACVGGNVDIIELLLNHGVAINERVGEAGVSPLMAAAIFNHENAMRLLLLHGADYNADDNYKNSILMRAIFAGAQNAITELLKIGPELKLDLQNERGDTALHIAVDQRLKSKDSKVSPATALALVLAGADPNIPNNKGETALHAAVYADNQELLVAVIMAGADLFALDDNSLTAIEIAKNNKLDTARVTLLLAEQLATTEPDACFPPNWIRGISYAVKRRSL